MAWTPPTTEPDPLTAGVRDFARFRLPQLFGQEITEPKTLGREKQLLANGQEAVIELKASPATRCTFGKRAAISYVLDGYAATIDLAYRARGDAIVDIKTRAFLNLNITLEPVGKVNGNGNGF